MIEATCCSCAAFADATTLVTGSFDHMVRLWSLKSSSNVHGPQRSNIRTSRLTLTHILRAHTASVSCVAASRTWSLVVSGAQDGTAVLWDLNRGVYVRSITHGTDANAAVHLVSINESTVSYGPGVRISICAQLYSEGLYCYMFKELPALAYHQCLAHCVIRLSQCCYFTHLSAYHLYGLLGAPLFAYRCPCYRRTRWYYHTQKLEH